MVQETAALQDFSPACDRFGVKLRHGGDVRCKTAFPPKAEVRPRSCYVANVPDSDVCIAAHSTTTITASANREQLRRNFRPSALADLASLRSRLWDLLANDYAATYLGASFVDAISARR